MSYSSSFRRAVGAIGLISLGLVALAAPAVAADLPSRKMAPVPIFTPEPVVNWTGLYGGVSLGFATDRYAFRYAFGSAPTGVSAGYGAIKSNGVLGGGQVGALYQLPWHLVVGAEIDAEASSTRGSLPVAFPGITGSIRTEIPYFGAFRAKFGYAFDSVPYVGNMLLYMVAGGAIAKVHDSAFINAGGNPLVFDRSTNRFQVSTHIGTVGIGAAHKITPNLSVFAEYRYTALGPQAGLGRSIQFSTPFAAGAFQTRAMYHLGSHRRELPLQSLRLTIPWPRWRPTKRS